MAITIKRMKMGDLLQHSNAFILNIKAAINGAVSSLFMKKNKIQERTTRNIEEYRTKFRLLLTDTPLQNNLKEHVSYYHFGRHIADLESKNRV